MMETINKSTVYQIAKSHPLTCIEPGSFGTLEVWSLNYSEVKNEARMWSVICDGWGLFTSWPQVFLVQQDSVVSVQNVIITNWTDDQKQIILELRCNKPELPFKYNKNVIS